MGAERAQVRDPDSSVNKPGPGSGTGTQAKGAGTMSSTRGRPGAGTGQDYEAGYPPTDYPPQAVQQQGYQQQRGYTEPGYQGQHVAYSGGAGAKVGSILAGVLMIVAGAYSFLIGLAMVTKAAFFTFPAGYAYNWTTHNWGWTQLALGAVVFAAGVCVMLGMVWARMVGVVLAVFSAVSSFLMLPFFPVWSIVLIAVDVFVIWALLTRGRRTQT
jgi:hypothetical protein